MRKVIRFLAALALSAPLAAAAEAWPARTLTIVAPGGAGGTSDVFARVLADWLAKDLGNAVIVENKAGAGTLLGAQAVARSKADGHTLLIGAAALTTSPHLLKEVTFDPLRELAPVRLIAHLSNVLIVPADSRIRSVADLLAHARAEPGRMTISNGGTGISEHLAAELFQSTTKTRLVHVPYKSSAANVMAVTAGEVQAGFANMTVALPAAKAGKVRAIAVTGAKRSAFLPEVPTIAESGLPGYEVQTWFGLLAPAGVPEDVLRRLDDSVARWIATAEMGERLRALGGEAAAEGPDAFRARIRAEYAKWAALVKEANLRAE